MSLQTDSSQLRVAAVGEILWDLLDTGRYLGGAPFNFTAHAARLGHLAPLVSAVGDDELGCAALDGMCALGVGSKFVSTNAVLKTGTVTVSLSADGQPAYTIHHPVAYDRIRFGADEHAAMAAFQPDWIYFGTLQPHSDLDGPCATLLRVLQAAPTALRFYDVNLRPASYTGPLVLQLLELADVVKLNIDEVLALQEIAGLSHASVEAFCRDCAKRFSLRAVCVTRGDAGCSLLVGNQFAEAPGFRVRVADTVGSGDAFAAAFLHGFTRGWAIQRIGEFSNRVGALVASRSGGTPEWNLDEALALQGLA